MPVVEIIKDQWSYHLSKQLQYLAQLTSCLKAHILHQWLESLQ